LEKTRRFEVVDGKNAKNNIESKGAIRSGPTFQVDRVIAQKVHPSFLLLKKTYTGKKTKSLEDNRKSRRR